MTSEYSLIIPTMEYQLQAYEYIQEFIQYKSEINGTGGLDRYNSYEDWLKKLDNDLDLPNIPPERVPANTYFFVRNIDNKILGMINISHRLNDYLLNGSGHIGYSIRPTERNKGYATIMLGFGLKRCRELDIKRTLITCAKENPASAKVIIKNGGIMENEIYSDTFKEVIQRYWISL